MRPQHCCPEMCGCLIPRGAQGQAGWSSGQRDLVPDLVVGTPQVAAGGLEN